MKFHDLQAWTVVPPAMLPSPVVVGRVRVPPRTTFASCGFAAAL